MPARRVLFRDAGLEVRHVACVTHRAEWSPREPSAGHTVVLVRRGGFRREVRGTESFADPTTAYFTRPGEEERFAHPTRILDSCSVLEFDEAQVAAMWGGETSLPERTIPTPPSADLAHRRLIASASRAEDPCEVAERALALVSSLLEVVDADRHGSGLPGRPSAQSRLVVAAREALTADPTIGLIELARCVAISPHHLSRIFRRHTGETVTRFRNRVRVRLALERLAAGDQDLSRLAADLGFSDHAHLTRTVRAEVGSPPSALRRVLRLHPEGADHEPCNT